MRCKNARRVYLFVREDAEVRQVEQSRIDSPLPHSPPTTRIQGQKSAEQPSSAMSPRFVPVQLTLSWLTVILSVLMIGFGVGTIVWEVDRQERWHAKSFAEGIIFATWGGFLLVWYIPW